MIYRSSQGRAVQGRSDGRPSASASASAIALVGVRARLCLNIWAHRNVCGIIQSFFSFLFVLSMVTTVIQHR